MGTSAENTSPKLSAAKTLAETGERYVKARSNLELSLRRFFRHKLAVIGLTVSLILVLSGLLAPVLAPYRYDFSNLMDANKFPSRDHLMGTDAIGRDYFSRILFGIRTSMMVGFISVFISCTIGIPLGLLGGLGGKWGDFVVMRIVEIMTAFPGLLFAIFLVSVLGSGVRNVILVIGLTSWLTVCRLVRAQLLTLREQDYVLAARSIGVSNIGIAVRHLLPNAIAPLVIVISLSIPAAIFTEAGLSFLGIGINEPTPSLGKMVSDGAPYMQLYWYLGFFPTLAIALAMLGFTFLGDGLRDALDPRQG
jgi:ABC-type dipeptide/oligopeptide/nickel transport system permease subunit